MENQMKRVIALALLAAAIIGVSASADEVKTQEQSIHEAMASAAGGTIRVLKGNKSECGDQYQGGEKEACEKGFDAQDKILKSPASK
ncbi:MAG: hypothetical protein PHT07_10705 [Paludibacter sp.]|nr:hypothetical protein [Paludibacter sp.]